MRTTTLNDWAQRLKHRGFAVIRVALYASAVCALFALLGARSAQGRIGEAALVVGRQLAGFEDLTAGSHRVSLNGETVLFASTLVDLPVSEVLDRVQEHCERGSILPREIVDSEALQQVFAGGVARTGVLRHGDDREGLVACLVADSSQSFVERMQRFAETLDLGDVGKLRYVYVRRASEGTSHAVIAWTEGTFRLGALTEGTDRDAPGSDPEVGLRPVASVRLLTADVQGAPAAVRIYRSSASVVEVLSAAERDFEGRGFSSVPGVGEAHATTRVFSKAGTDTWLVAHPDGDGTVVSLLSERAAR